MLKGFDKVDPSYYFKISNTKRTRGHSFKLEKKSCKSEIRKHFFSHRIVNSWNSLSQEVVDAETVNCFKNRLDKFNHYACQ